MEELVSVIILTIGMFAILVKLLIKYIEHEKLKEDNYIKF